MRTALQRRARAAADASFAPDWPESGARRTRSSQVDAAGGHSDGGAPRRLSRIVTATSRANTATARAFEALRALVAVVEKVRETHVPAVAHQRAEAVAPRLSGRRLQRRVPPRHHELGEGQLAAHEAQDARPAKASEIAVPAWATPLASSTAVIGPKRMSRCRSASGMIENPRSTSTSCRDAQDVDQPRLVEDVGELRSERKRQRLQPGRHDGREDHRRRGSRMQVSRGGRPVSRRGRAPARGRRPRALLSTVPRSRSPRARADGPARSSTPSDRA
jgi:hypothetical protein